MICKEMYSHVKKRLITASVFLFGLFLISPSLYAEVINLTLPEAIGLGVKNSSTLQAKMLAVYAAQATVQSAKSSYYPSISTGINYTHFFNRQKTPDITFDSTTIPGAFTTAADPVTFSADLNQPFYTFGKIKNAIGLADENVGLAELDFEEEKRDLIVEIQRAFYWYILAKEVLAVHKETLAYKKEALEVAKKRYEAGLSPDYDVLAAESDIESFMPEVISADNQVRFALLAVKDLLSIEEEEAAVGFEIELIGDLEPDYFDFEREKLIEKALSTKYEIQQYRHNISLSEIQKSLARSQRRPDIAGFASYTLQSGFDPTTGDVLFFEIDRWEGYLTAGVNFSMPLSSLFPWSREKANLTRDELNLEQVKIGMSSLESGIKLNIENILLKLEEEKAKIASGEKAVRLAQRLFESSRERYANGLISSIELQDAQITLNNAKLGHLTAIYNYKLAQFDLMDAVGVEHFEN
jgi:outer membrane protein TolC